MAYRERMDREWSRANIYKRLANQLGCPELLDRLAEQIGPSDLQSLLLEVYKRRSKARTAAAVLTQYRGNRFVQPSRVNPVAAASFDQLAYSLLPGGFSVLELSPLAPFGSCSAVAPVSQDKIVTTIRNTEVCADATNVLALEAAVRRQGKGRNTDAEVNLCCSHRQVRCQPTADAASFAHFRVLALCTAGREKERNQFKIRSMSTHLRYYTALLLQTKKIGYGCERIRIELIRYGNSGCQEILDHVGSELESLVAKHHVQMNEKNVENNSYYEEVGFHVFGTNKRGEEYFLVDGGFTNWTKQLLNNKKEDLLTSGIGSERFLYCFQDA